MSLYEPEKQERWRIVRLDASALKTDHRRIPSEKEGEFDWCIGEQVFVTFFGKETILIKNRMVDDIGPVNDFESFWSWGGIVDGDEVSSVSFVIADDLITTGSISSSIIGYYELHHINDDYYLVYEMKRMQDEPLDRDTQENFWDDTVESPPLNGSLDGAANKPQSVNIAEAVSMSGGACGIVKINGFATEDFVGGPSTALSLLQRGTQGHPQLSKFPTDIHSNH